MLTLTTLGETPQPVQNSEYLFVTFDFLVGDVPLFIKNAISKIEFSHEQVFLLSHLLLETLEQW